VWKWTKSFHLLTYPPGALPLDLAGGSAQTPFRPALRALAMVRLFGKSWIRHCSQRRTNKIEMDRPKVVVTISSQSKGHDYHWPPSLRKRLLLNRNHSLWWDWEHWTCSTGTNKSCCRCCLLFFSIITLLCTICRHRCRHIAQRSSEHENKCHTVLYYYKKCLHQDRCCDRAACMFVRSWCWLWFLEEQKSHFQRLYPKFQR